MTMKALGSRNLKTTLPAHLPADQVALAQAWIARCETGQFSPAVVGIGTVRVFGQAGDAPVTFPRITSLDALDTLAPDEQWAATYAIRVVETHTTKQRPIFAMSPGQATSGTRVTALDLTSKVDYLILSPIQGG
jgi:predicted transcriptional regulator